MAAVASAAAAVDLYAAFIAVEIFSILDPQQLGADPSAQAALLVELLLPLAVLGALATAVAAIYRHLQHSAAVAGTRRLRRLFSILCASAGSLEFLFFVRPAGVGGDVGAHARALGLAAARVLPLAAAATFYIGMALIIIAHTRAGGEVGGGAFAADGDRVVSFLTKMAFAAAAALIGLTAMVALYGMY